MSDFLSRKDILGLRDFTRQEIELVLDTAASMEDILQREIKKVPSLRGKTVVNLFFEPSTRTRTSFEIAGKRLSADVVNFSAAVSSVKKGETLLDTARNIEAMKPDVLVVRHSSSGAPHFLARHLSVPVVNAGDGRHEHPSQGLLDLYTIRKVKGRIEGLNVLILGDILHSRVARSDIYGLTTMGAKVTICGPSPLIPREYQALGVEATWDINEALRGKDVVIVLRIQLERMESSFFPSIREYVRYFGLNRERMKLAKEDAIVMHPGPVNRGWELADDLADSDVSVILQQVEAGVAVRMAILYLLAHVREEVES
ncbi:MAG: aspartate carbamoyltransferase catalytic subunit [Deltaproteobacteria bacterium]|nr:MAG: aspartate carbamoyltransferase catalytic subunit [Deltaproteobacteria bacterium]